MPSERELDQLVEAIAERVHQRLTQQEQHQAVPPLQSVIGAWQDPSSQALESRGIARLGSDGSVSAGAKGIARYIDHTMLKPTSTRADILKTCKEAREFGFASVCVNSVWIGMVAKELRGTHTMPICVVGFPLGAAMSEAKAAETRAAIAAGAEEIDMVINIGALKSGDHDLVLRDIEAVVRAAQGRPVKVILENTMLNREEKIAGCALSKAGGAAFVKTSTGFGGGGATIEDVTLMRQVVGPEMGVKASGGVRTAQDAQNMIKAGATRLGASASVAIVTGGTGTGSY